MMLKVLTAIMLICITVEARNTVNGKLDKKFKSILSNLNDLKSRYKQLRNHLEILKKNQRCSFCIKQGSKTICDCTNLQPEKDCMAFNELGIKKDGFYRLSLGTFTTIRVFCDQTTQGGGWTVIQRRVDNSTDFYRGWAEYREGFGEENGNLWIGNDNIHELTKPSHNPNNASLLIEMVTKSQSSIWAKYNSFSIEDEAAKYKLHVSGYTGNERDNMKYHNNVKFSTYDQDNDQASGGNCAIDYKNPWWNKNCNQARINSPYDQLYWGPHKSIHLSYLSYSVMKIRRNK